MMGSGRGCESIVTMMKAAMKNSYSNKTRNLLYMFVVVFLWGGCKVDGRRGECVGTPMCISPP